MSETESLTSLSDLSKSNSFSEPEAFISNSLPHLCKLFFANLKKSLQNGKLRHIVVTPSNGIKKCLTQQGVLQEKGIFGLRFLSLPQAIEHIMKLSSKKPLRFVHHHELFLFLYTRIEEKKNENDHLNHYIKNRPEVSMGLAEELSHNFISYGLYGLEAIQPWLDEGGWQQDLFRETLEVWDYPFTFPEKTGPLKVDTQFHLFCLPFLPQIYRTLFERAGSMIYHRTPTPHFTSDVLSDRSLYAIDHQFQLKGISVEQRKQFQEISKEPNRLFANFSKALIPIEGWVKELEGSSLYFQDEVTSTLKEHQSLIYELCNDSPKEKCDPSIQVHSAPSKIREVEIILDQILDYFAENPDKTCQDVQIFAPNIEEYTPAIEFVFKREECPFGYEMRDLSPQTTHGQLETILSFFSLTKSRFKLKEIKEFTSSPHFQKPSSLNSEELHFFWKLFEKWHVHWGYDQEMRQEILSYDIVNGRGTFKDVLEKIVSTIPFVSSPLEISSLEAFGSLYQVIQSIASTMTSLKKESHSIGQWVERVSDIVEETFTEGEEKEKFLKGMRKLTSLSDSVPPKLPFAPIMRIIEEICTGKKASVRFREKPPLTFSSIKEGEIAAPSMTVLMSMNEDDFVRKRQPRSLNELEGKEGSDHCPSTAEKDKLFFLEALCYTTDRLVISYTNQSSQDHKEISSSLLVDELIRKTPGLSAFHHPPLGYTKEAAQQPMTPFFYFLATSEKKNDEGALETITLENDPACELSSLTRCFHHPLRFFLQERCGIYLEGSSRDLEQEAKEFMISYKLRAQIKKEALLKSSDEIMAHIDLTSPLPTALFTEAAEIEVRDEVEKSKTHLKEIGIDRSDFFEIILDPSTKAPFWRNDHEFLHPPLLINDKILYGSLSMVTKKGVVSLCEKSTASLWKEWIKIVVLQNLEGIDIPHHLFFTGANEPLDTLLKDPKKSLKLAVDYMNEALLSPSPLMPERIKSYTPFEENPFTKGLFKDPYLEQVKPDFTKDWSKHVEEVRELI